MSLPPVPLRVPVLAENGLISRDWVRYFTALSDGISGAITGESLTVTGAITGASLVVSGNVTAADVHAARFFRTDYAAAQGEWTAFTPTRTASAGAWTAGTVTTAAYTRIGKTMTVVFSSNGTSVSNAGVVLQVTIPGGLVAAKQTIVRASLTVDNGAVVDSYVIVQAAATLMQVAPSSGLGFAISATNTSVYFVMTLEVQ